MFFSVRSWTLRARLRALPESTVSLKTSYFSRESTFRVASDFFEAGGVRYALTLSNSPLLVPTLT